MKGKFSFILILVLMLVPLAVAQTAPPAGDDAAQIKQALADAQATLRAQQELLRQMQQQLADQAREIAALRDQQHATSAAADAARAGTTELQAAVAALRAPTQAPAGTLQTKQSQLPPGPLAAPAPGLTIDQPGELFFRLGNATFTPSGWVDFTAYFRTTDVGSGLGTSFAAIPFNNVVQGGQSEVRFSSQSSRIGMRVDEAMGKFRGYGYLEADFNGYQPTNAYVSTNANTMRMRVYYVDLARGRWEGLGGQSWSLITPTRKALSPFLADLYNTFHLDTNLQAGLPWARQAQFRLVYHGAKGITAGASLENPEQYSGSTATFPALFSTTETDVNSSTGSGGATTTPNVHPDVMAKVTWDRKLNGRTYHLGAAGLLTSVRVFTPESVTKTVSHKDEREGGAVAYNLTLELLKNFRLLSVGYWSDGGGRYIGALGPGFVVLQPGTATSPFRAALIHAGSGVSGFEFMPTKKTTISGLVSAAYFQRRYGRDPSVTTATWIGYGYPGSPNSQNRIIKEASLTSTSNLWEKRGYGALQFITQSSYVLRDPWYVAKGTPKDAHTYMEYMSLRYVIP